MSKILLWNLSPGLYTKVPVMAVLEPVPVPPIQMAFLVNSLDTTTLLRFLAELFLSNIVMRSGDIEINPGPESYRGIGELVLRYVAEIITQREKIQSVGKGLGIPPNEIDMYVALSDIEGAYEMLKYWKENSPAEEQLKYLTAALTGDACPDVARILMPDDHVERSGRAVTSALGLAALPSGGGGAAGVAVVLGGAAAVVRGAAAFVGGAGGAAVAAGTAGCVRAVVAVAGGGAAVVVNAAAAATAAVATGARRLIASGVAAVFNEAQAGRPTAAAVDTMDNETPVGVLSSQSRQIVSLTDEMIRILVIIQWPREGLSSLGRAMQLTPQKIESYREQNIHDNISGSEEMIKKWRQSLRDQNQVAAMCELLVKANMKPQADEFYEKCDRIINSKTLKTLMKMINDAPPDPLTEKVTNHENTVINTFDEHGGHLYLKRYDVTLQIPSGAFESGSSQQIALKVLTEMPLQLDLWGNEMIASFGFQCFPSGKTFKKPVTLTMPHCIDLLDPAKCELMLHLVQDKLDITRSKLSPETCRVRKNNFDLSLKHFSWGFVTWLWNLLWIRGINMLCMPYLPSQVPPDRVILQICLYKHIKGCEASVGRGGNDNSRACLSNAEEFTLQSRGKLPLTVSYQFGGENEIPDSQTLTHEDIAQIVARKSIFFVLNLAGRGNSNLITLWLKPHRSQPIKFITTFEPRPTTMIRDETTINRTVSEAQLTELSKKIPFDNYTEFCNKLSGIPYNKAMSELQRFNNNHIEAYKKVLMEWRDRTGGPEDGLKAASEAAGMGGLVHAELLLDGAEINQQSFTNQIHVQQMKEETQTGLQTSPHGWEERNRREQRSFDRSFARRRHQPMLYSEFS